MANHRSQPTPQRSSRPCRHTAGHGWPRLRTTGSPAGTADTSPARWRIPGTAGRRGPRGLLAAVRFLESNGIAVVFPEGTRDTGPDLGRFRSGAFDLARVAGVPIVPVAIIGTAGVPGQERPALPPCPGATGVRRAPAPRRTGASSGPHSANAAAHRPTTSPLTPPQPVHTGRREQREQYGEQRQEQRVQGLRTKGSRCRRQSAVDGTSGGQRR
ncbi:lysophospholipid acyltransferase family protein [Streptomyces sp. HC307]|uniref:lysophospholipid acyltransferase family protein n=1 Tax=Streptomyces flavusporus TaxID=3385496 RepID=UPI003916EC4B